MSNKQNPHKFTPPQTNKKVRNPFDKALIDRLHKPICSPGMCKIYKKEQGGSFRWDIDQACNLVPADIVACNSQFEPSPDPALEKFAEETTDKFFSQEMVMPSPLESSKKVKPLLYSSSKTYVYHRHSAMEQKIITKDVSAQTVLTLPRKLPPELETALQSFCTFTEDQCSSEEYEITANGSLCYKLCFEENIDVDYYDSEQTDEEVHMERRPPSSFESHAPILFSPDVIRKSATNSVKRTFDTPHKKVIATNTTSEQVNGCYRNKLLDVVDGGEASFGSIEFQTPIRNEQKSYTSSLASVSISPVTKATSSDEEKNNFTSPESDTMAVCLDCISEVTPEKKGPCFCKAAPNKIKRSASLKGTPDRSRKSSISITEKRSLSLSSLHRSRSVQKLDFSMDMSIDGSTHDRSQDSEYSPQHNEHSSWSMVEECSMEHTVKSEFIKGHLMDVQSSTKIDYVDIFDNTPVKGKCKSMVRSHEISKIRVPLPLSPLHMSLDNSLEVSDNVLSLEDKKIDFNTVDLNCFNVSQFNNRGKVSEDCSTSLKKVDSGYNENTFYANASSYYESAIKPSELTVTNAPKTCNKNVLKEISNIHWMRVDSGFKDENSSDSIQFYTTNENLVKNEVGSLNFEQKKLNDKENIATDTFTRFFGSSDKGAMSVSESFTDDMTFSCNFSSTPSKKKTRKVQS